MHLYTKFYCQNARLFTMLSVKVNERLAVTNRKCLNLGQTY